MKPRYCQVPHNPPHSYGDCIRACIATMIDRDDVPHTFDGADNEKSWYDLRSYLKSHGKNIALFIYEGDDPMDWMREVNHDITYMLMGSDKHKVNHAIVVSYLSGMRTTHNPSYTTMTDPLIEGFYVICVIV